jgi:hypothetical protein
MTISLACVMGCSPIPFVIWIELRMLAVLHQVRLFLFSILLGKK